MKILLPIAVISILSFWWLSVHELRVVRKTVAAKQTWDSGGTTNFYLLAKDGTTQKVDMNQYAFSKVGGTFTVEEWHRRDDK